MKFRILPQSCRTRILLVSVFCACAPLPSVLAQSETSAIPPAPSNSASAAETAAASPDASPAELPDAPSPASEAAPVSVDESSSVSAAPDPLGFPDAEGFGVSPGIAARVPLNQCPYDTTHAKECRVHWRQLLITSAVFNAFQNGGNLYTGFWYRYETTHGPWFDEWFESVVDWHWNSWSDKNPFLDDYVGHPMMGAITNAFWIQNDPKGMTLEYSNNKEYWRSRLRAMAFSTAYSFEWKFGPFGEAGVGHIGDDKLYGPTDESGVVELVTTPVGGLLWTVAEDLLDKHVVRRIEEKPRNPFTLLLISFLTPARGTGNILRFRPPWYRDSREVKARSFFSDPPGPEMAGDTNDAAPGDRAETSAAAIQPVRPAALPIWPHYGGVHEFGAWWGLSLMSGHIWGYAGDVKFMPIDVNYSYLLLPKQKWNLRYSPEMTALALMDEHNPQAGPPAPFDLKQRMRAYGSGVSPVGFRTTFLPESRVQPYLSTNGGFIYFDQRVLSPQGSQFMYTIDFGCGLTIFRKQRQSVSIGYRYQHMSNANISHHNPGTDANTFYVAVSRFRTKGYR